MTWRDGRAEQICAELGGETLGDGWVEADVTVGRAADDIVLPGVLVEIGVGVVGRRRVGGLVFDW